MTFKMIIGLLGGLGLFVYGMKLMGDGLEKAAGEKLKRILEVLTSNTFMGILVGAGITAVMNSSSATTVMTVGFVNAGLMNLAQAAGVIMGANIGTTMTAQLIAFKLSDIAPLILAIGAAMVIFSKKKKTKDIGEIILGFGVLFVGMNMMETSMSPLKDNEGFRNLILVLKDHPYMGVFIGFGMTAVVQSSGATIGILMALAAGNAIPLNVALPILFGDNIGTCVTALLASIGTGKNAKKAALIHLTFNAIGTCIFMLALPLVVKGVAFIGGDIRRQIANAHTMFNLANVAIQAPFIPFLVKFVNKLVPGEEQEENALVLQYLDKRLLETPAVAFGQLSKEVIRMADLASKNITISIDAFVKDDDNLIKEVYENEKVINFLEKEITGYMVLLANEKLSEFQSEKVTALFHVVNDLERIGDHAENIAELAQYKGDFRLQFSSQAIEEVQMMYGMTKKAVESAIYALDRFDFESASKVIEMEKEIDMEEKRLRAEHIDRLNNRTCQPASGTVFLDILTNLERVGDHSTNVAEMVLSFKHN